MMEPRIKRQRLVFSEKLMYSFIRDYRDSGCLWDINNPDYKCAEKRRAALSGLAAKYDITEEEAKRKLNSLRSTYLQEKKKVEESKKNGGDIYEPSLYWFHELEFLYDVIIPRRTPRIHPPASPTPTTEVCQVIVREQKEEVINQEEVDQEHLIFEYVPDSSEQQIFTNKLDHAAYTAQPPRGVRKLNMKRRLLKKPVHQQQFADYADIPEYTDVHPTQAKSHERTCHSPQPSSLVQQGDEFDKFCCSIASQLRTLPPADGIEMQLEIQQLVSRRRLAVLKNQQSLSMLRSWENGDGYHQSGAMENDSGQSDPRQHTWCP